MSSAPDNLSRWAKYLGLGLSLLAALYCLLFRGFLWPVPPHVPLLAFPEVLLNAAALGLTGLWVWRVARSEKRGRLVLPLLLFSCVLFVTINTSSERWNYRRFAKVQREKLEQRLWEYAKEEGLPLPTADESRKVGD